MVSVNQGKSRVRLSLRQVEAFHAVVISGTVSGAADRMHVSQPAVSRLITDLEQALGFALFERRGRKLHLRDEGAILYREVESSFVGLEKIARRAEEIRDFRTGQLRIAASPALSFGLLPDVIDDFRRAYRKVTLRTHVEGSAKVAEWVATGQVDIGFAAPPVRQEGLTILPFDPVPCCCVLPKGHPLARKKIIGPSDLRDSSLIVLGSESQLRARIDVAFESEGVKPETLLETSVSAHAAILAEKDLGIAIIDPFSALTFRSRNVVLRPFSPNTPYDYLLLLPIQTPQTRLADAFVEFVRNRLSVLVPQLQGAEIGTGP